MDPMPEKQTLRLLKHVYACMEDETPTAILEKYIQLPFVPYPSLILCIAGDTEMLRFCGYSVDKHYWECVVPAEIAEEGGGGEAYEIIKRLLQKDWVRVDPKTLDIDFRWTFEEADEEEGEEEEGEGDGDNYLTFPDLE